MTVGALRRAFQNVIRHAGSGMCNTIEDAIEGNFGTFRIAAFTRFKHSLSFLRDCLVEDYV